MARSSLLAASSFVVIVSSGCDRAAPAAVDAAPVEASAGTSPLRDALLPLAAACPWDPGAGTSPCPAFDAFGHVHAGDDPSRERTARGCLALVTDPETKRTAAACVRFYAGRELREDVVGALVATNDRSVRLELALATKKLRVSKATEGHVLALVAKLPPNDPSVTALLGALLPETEGGEPSAEAFAVATTLLRAPALNVHGAASNVMEASRSRRAEYCAEMGKKVGADVRAFSWEGDWIFPRLTSYAECDAEVARLVPTLVAAIGAFAEGERPAWALGSGLGFVGTLEDSRPLAEASRKRIAEALERVAKRGEPNDRKVASAIALRYREKRSAPP